MGNSKQRKKELRQNVATLKQQYSEQDLLEKSKEVFSVVELTGVFQEAKKIFIYHSMKGEVSTIDFVNKWQNEKEFYLPVVNENTLVFRKYNTNVELKRSTFGVLEPVGTDFTDYRTVDLIIVPGVAFDGRKNRLGYGKGYYDKFLLGQKMPKMGICFDFQLLDELPTEKDDIAMDYVVSENDLIW